MASFDSPCVFWRSPRRCTLLVAAAITAGLAANVQADTVTQSSPTSIQNLKPGYSGTLSAAMVTSAITLPSTLNGTITDVSVTVNIDTVDLGDLTIKLTGPARYGLGTGVGAMLLNRPGTSGNNVWHNDNGSFPGTGSDAYLSINNPITYDPNAASGAYSFNMGQGLTGVPVTSPTNYIPSTAGAVDAVDVGSTFDNTGKAVDAGDVWTLYVGFSGSSINPYDAGNPTDGDYLASWSITITTSGNTPFDTTVPEPVTAIGAAGAIAGLLAYLTGRRGRVAR